MATPSSILGIEIGGTKLQLGVADAASGRLLDVQRAAICRSKGARGVLDQIARAAPPLIERHRVGAIGIGFGGPVDGAGRRAITSHQVTGWDDFPLADWCQHELGCDAVVGNDCNAAALAEARQGAGRGLRRVFYVTVGTGIGGGLVIDGRIDGQERPAVAEIGHLRPGLQAVSPHATVESLASGLAIEQETRRRMAAPGEADARSINDLQRRCEHDPARLTTQLVAQAAKEDNLLAAALFERATEALGWAIAQMVTLVAPQRVVVGGGVSLMGDWLFERVRGHARRFVFPPLLEAWDLVPAELGELVVIHGAVELARELRV